MTTQNQNYSEKANKLSSELWEMANALRGNIDSSKFKDYIFGIIFYRFPSEKVEAMAKETFEDDGCTYEEACNGAVEGTTAEEVYEYISDILGYYIKPENLFSTMIKKINKEYGDEVFTVEDLELAIKELPKNTSKASERVFDGLFDDLRLQSTELGASVADRTAIISNVMQRVNNIDFDMEHPEYDLIGTAYMILIGLFASDAGKKGGEFFTPVGPSKLCVELSTYGLKEAKNIADCTCGSASMLLEAKKHLPDGFGHIYGQEKNSTTYNLARMNMIMHNVPWDKFDLYNCDTLTNDCYKDKNGNDIKMTVQVCNPPYSLKWSSDKSFDDDPRYSGAGKLAPKAHADFAFLEHMMYHMDDEDGRVAVLLPAGVLFRGGAEDKIRKYIVKTMNRVDAVVMLPGNLFHGTSIPVCLMVLKSNRGENSGNILFIDASKEFEAGKKQNVLTDENIEKIVAAYGERKDIPGFAKVASMEEIEENGYNLNIPRYVNDADEEEEPMSAEEVVKKLGELKTDEAAAEEKIMGVMKELGVA